MIEMPLTDDDKHLIRILILSDIPRSVAYTLAFMRDKDEVTSVQIEREAGLRQPEVSISMQWLRRRGWVNKRNIKKEGKGRPVHGYKLSENFSDILNEIIADLENRIDEIRDKINQLKRFIR